jgi:hypothetical protein
MCGILLTLIGAPWCPDQIRGLFKDLGLPFHSDKAFVSQQITGREIINYCYSSQAFIQIGWNQVIDDGNSIQSGYCDQLISEIFEISTYAMTIVGAAQKIATAFAAFVGHHWNWIGIHQITSLLKPPFLGDPKPSQFFYKKIERSRPTIVLTLVNQLGKQI